MRSPTPPPSRDPSRWAPELTVGIVLGALALVQLDRRPADGFWPVAIAVGAVAAAVLSRHAPAVALALVWAVGAAQLFSDTPLLVVELGIGLVAFGCARWGRPATVVASALSIPAATVIGLVSVANYYYYPVESRRDVRALIDLLSGFGDTWVAVAVAAPMLLLAGPWFAGLTLRYGARAATSRRSQTVAEEAAARAVRESEQAREIARLRDDQARLARDVHDVVGHSLAVILAQAESAQYLPDADSTKLKETMTTIATSARASLQDVRQVLAPDGDRADAAPRPLDTLVEGVRASGHEVVSRELGTPQPMPPELEVVAYRALQEMLTNALKHGRRDEPVFVERLWPDGAWAGELRIEVRNSIEPAPAAAETPAHGQGLDGMRRRLDACGGRLDVARREEEDDTTFTVTAWVPVSRR